MRRVFFALAFAAAVAPVLSCGGSGSSRVAPTVAPAASQTPVPSTAPSTTKWLCLPGQSSNPCESGLAASLIAADGTSTTETASAAEDPPIDCFYVYPTVSRQTTTNADLSVDPEQTAVAIHQASRFSEVCKVYAPMYRQMTLSGIRGILSGELPTADTAVAAATAYGDVLSAWQDYLEHYNNGRGVVLIGHSQGTLMLTHLAAAQIDPNPDVRKLMVSALLIGGNVTVAKGKDVGGHFENIPACRSADQTGCVVAYSTFLERPPADAAFGRADAGVRGIDQVREDVEVLCVNPASIAGGTGELKPYFSTAPFPGLFDSTNSALPSASTPWIAYPGLYTGQCESANGANWLQVDPTNVTGDQRPKVTESIGPGWGLHLYDVNIALGNLVDLVHRQASAYGE